MTPSLIEHYAREAEYYRRVLPAWKATGEAIRDMQWTMSVRLGELLREEIQRIEGGHSR